ncbi:MAG: hypothetical protein DBX47_06275 [Clostridiales bacterium]|nr:MAG: hypothetical protein DBX47_06275 [Clostridiales bacterium]
MTVYKYDGTLDGFFSTVFEIYTTKTLPDEITSSEEIQLGLETNIINIITDDKKALRIKNSIIKNIGADELHKFDYAFASCDEQKEMKMFSFARLVFKHGSSVLHMMSLIEVINFNLMVSKVTLEVEHIKGFLRFAQLSNGLFLASYTPDNDITCFILPYFADRNGAMNFIIFDKSRNKMGLFNGEKYEIITCNENIPEIFTEEEAYCQSMWQQYFETVSIASRKNKRLQNRALPIRYRRNMSEFSSR